MMKKAFQKIPAQSALLFRKFIKKLKMMSKCGWLKAFLKILEKPIMLLRDHYQKKNMDNIM